ncbi:MAG TPA: NAD(P)H-binding protein [Solirubrobacteraceae bacterium]|nr:NAD(P)H-binding protein [Solirubrobacteraceae bacterium]
MLLLTGATGQIGTALLPRLIARGEPVRVLVRDPRGLGAERVRVQIALGDLTDPPSFRNALRGVDTVVHLAASARDQARGSIEELNGIATWRLVQAAERAGVEHFVLFGALAASVHDRTRFLRSKALAEEAVRESGLRHTVLAPSLVFSPGDPHLTLLERLARLPLVPVPGRGRALFQPIWAEDVADCALAVLDGAGGERYELAGPDTLDHLAIAELVLRAAGRPRRLLPVPERAAKLGLKSAEALLKSKAPAVWDEAELLQVPMVSRHGTADAERLGVTPRAMAAVLGASR